MLVPLVSVIVPVHNAERHLPSALESIRLQTLTDIEIILVDDGSTDASGRIMAEYAASDARTRVITGPARGSAGAARNAGLAIATGDYLAFLDADDYFVPSMLKELHDRAVADNADVMACKFRIHNEVTKETTPANWVLRLEHLPRRRPFSPDAVGHHLFFAFNPAAWNKLFRTAFIREHGLEFQNLRRTNDAYFTFMALALAERISYLDRYLINYRTANSDSLQGTIDESPLEFLEALEAMRSKLIATGRWEKLERAFVNQALTLCITNLRRPKTTAGFLEVYNALRTDVFERFGILDRPRGYFVRRGLYRDRDTILELSPEEYLFTKYRDAAAKAEKAQAEVKQGLREIDLRGRRPAADAPAPIVTPGPRPTPVTPPDAPDVSVIIPVYNTLAYLSDCLASVQRQSECSLEIICVDDGSSDGSEEVLDVAAQEDPRIHVIHQDNAGLSAARNTGVAAATGRYVCFVDSDDYWRLDALAELVNQADEAALDVLLFDAQSLREPGVSDELWEEYQTYYERQPYDGVRTGPALLTAMHRPREYRASACLYLVRRDLLVEHGLQFYPGITHEDNLFTFELLLQAQRASHTQTTLYARRVRAGSIVTTGGQVAAAQGYFVTCVEMFRFLQRSDLDESAGNIVIGDLPYGAFRAARNIVVDLPEDIVNRLRDVDPGADAQAIYLLLRRAWREERSQRLLAQRLKNAARRPTPSWRRHPLVQRLKPIVKRVVGRRS